MVLLGGNDEARGTEEIGVFVFCYNRVEILIFEQGSSGKGCINDMEREREISKLIKGLIRKREREISKLIKGLIRTMILKGQQKTCTHVQGKPLFQAEDR